MSATVHTGTATAVVPTKLEFDALTKTVTDLATGVATLVQQHNALLAEVLTDENRIKALEAPPIVVPPVVIPPPPVSGLPDPLLLPAATQQIPDPLAYDLLNVPSWAPGQSYTDPLTGVTIVKLTSPTSPVPGTATEMCGVDYATGGLRIGRPTNGVYPITVYRSPDGTGDYHVITFNPSTKAVGYRSPAPGVSSREISRAMSYVNANVMYAFSGAVLHSYGIGGATPIEIGVGKDWSAHLHGQTRFVWLQSTADDRYFAAQAGDAGPWVVVWDSQTDTFYEHQFASFNEFKMSKDSPYIHATGTRVMWDVLNNVERTFTGPTTYLSHNDTLRRYLEACDVNANPGIFTYTDLESPSPAITTISSAFYIGNLYQSGGWVDQARDLTQWVLLAYQTGGSAHPNELLQRGGLGMARLDFSGGLRLLCHTFNLGDVNGVPAYYTNSLWPNMSPDGKFCLFKSNMNRLGGFSSLFAAILPTVPVVIPPPVVVPPPPVPVIGFHEPTGLTPIEVMDWTAGLGTWWLNFIDAAKPITIMPVTDGPLGIPAQILRIGYQQGSSGGGGTELGRWLNVPVSELYWRYWVRVNPQWQGHNSGINKMVYVDDASPPQSGAFSAMWYEMYGGGSNPLGLYVVNQTNPSPLGGYVDAQQRNIFSRGVWHLVEIHQRQGQPGQVQVWVDGVLQLDVPAMTKAAPIGLLVISGIWGGVGDTKVQTDFMDFGPMWISGR